MSGTDQADSSSVGVVESAAVQPIFIGADGVPYKVHARAVLRKYDTKEDGSEWTEEEMADGSAERAGALSEVIVMEDGKPTERWVRGETEDGPPEG